MLTRLSFVGFSLLLHFLCVLLLLLLLFFLLLLDSPNAVCAVLCCNFFWTQQAASHRPITFAKNKILAHVSKLSTRGAFSSTRLALSQQFRVHLSQHFLLFCLLLQIFLHVEHFLKCFRAISTFWLQRTSNLVPVSSSIKFFQIDMNISKICCSHFLISARSKSLQRA